MIQATAIRKRYGRLDVLNGTTFTAHDGAITTLLGVNGAGKTTTLRIVCGLLKADGGSVLVDGVSVEAEPLAAKQQMGILPDRFGLYPHLTPREHLEFFGRLQGLSPEILEARVLEVRATLDMGPFFERPARHLSLGQSMKVALGRALLHSPRNIVMDEPTRGLDVLAIRALRGLLRELRDQGRAVFITNHSLAEVEELSDRVLILAGGEIVAEGSAEEVRRRAGAETLEESFVKLSSASREVA
ncbi:MAG: ABC transporter ATP-binding protein [Gemmatimonadota bacterium]